MSQTPSSGLRLSGDNDSSSGQTTYSMEKYLSGDKEFSERLLKGHNAADIRDRYKTVKDEVDACLSKYSSASRRSGQ
ncbi:hypothetical protein QBC38DRAFT_134870 [Podospora fimiseda]|uniref:Uncharacterized protein n=1 Tax=Podospora fimiseda TaxID=252190 RepID=A0AAN6YM67_9PEZI|nr:hypothetical protein QBC38DRAFT_134870 [Podospora fimiseda]